MPTVKQQFSLLKVDGKQLQMKTSSSLSLLHATKRVKSRGGLIVHTVDCSRWVRVTASFGNLQNVIATLELKKNNM